MSNPLITYFKILTSKIRKLYTIYLIPALILVGIWIYSLVLINGNFDFLNYSFTYTVSKIFFATGCWLFLAVGFANFMHPETDTSKVVWKKFVPIGVQLASITLPLTFIMFLPSNPFNLNLSYAVVAWVLALISLIWGFTSQYLIPKLSQYKTINSRYSYSVFSWQLIWQSVLNFILVGIASLIVLFGVTLIPVSLSLLFKIEIDSKVYSSTTASALILFSGLFYLVEFPAKSEIHKWFGNSIEAGSFMYPRFLAVLLPYVGLPVVTIYAAILNVFVVSILISGNWPQEGIIYYMISLIGSTVLVIMALEPVLSTRKVFRIWTRLLYVFSLPSVAVYFYGIILRIQDQGFSINRYFVILIGIVLLLTVINNLINRLPKFSVTLLIILVLGLVSVINPIGVSATVARSQSNLTLSKLRDLGLLQDSILKPQPLINEENSAYLLTRFEILDSLGKLDVVTTYLNADSQNKYLDFKSYLEKRNSTSSSSLISETELNDTNLTPEAELYDTNLNSSNSRPEWLITYLGGATQFFLDREKIELHHQDM